MNGTGQRAARTALDAARAAVDQLDTTVSPDDAAARLFECWASVEQSLQAMAGTSALTGQPLLRELRQRDLLTLAEAHALIDFGSLAERARAADYVPAARDRDTARAAVDQLTRVVDRGGPAASRPATPASRSTSPLLPREESVPPHDTPASSGNWLGRTMAAGAALVLIAGAGYAAFAFGREPSDLRRGRAAYAAGDHLTARSAFAAVAGEYPKLAEPHLYLGRMAREAGDMGSANGELRQAVALEPSNYAAHRELAALLLVTGRPDLARAFYERAIRLNPEDRTSLGYMGCTMVQLGRADLAQRFFSRAGAGPWGACAAMAPPADPAQPPGAPR